LVFGKPYDILPFRALADKIAQDAVAAIKKHVDDAGDIDNIVLAGGSSFFYKPTIQAAFPRHTLHVVPSPVFANVRGFQLAGEWLYRHQHQAQHVSPAAAAA
jgi:plasmid segregation protein ParM